MRLEGKIAIVTGAAQGIGRATALRLAEEGANVVVADIDVERANKVVDEVRALGSDGIVTKTDVSKYVQAEAMAKATLDRFGQIDILVNNAGGSARERSSPFNKSTEEVWDYVLGLNLKGTLNCTRAVINHMIERRNGRIVSMSSIAALMGREGYVDYTVAKAGIIGFTRALAKEVARYGIRVNCVSPGPVLTEYLKKTTPPQGIERSNQRTGFGRWASPEEIASVVAFLVSDDASFITGQNYPVCGLSNLG